MHHGRPTFHKKMKSLQKAVDRRARALLVNTVWQENPADYDDLLKHLHLVNVREPISKKDLAVRHGVDSIVCLDYSYFRSLECIEATESFDGEIVCTDYFDRGKSLFRSFDLPVLKGAPELSMTELIWPQFVGSLRGASLLVTGRHHAVYAACRARTPFAAIEGNTHKIEGLIRASGISIPTARTAMDLPAVIEWADQNHDPYQRLFDWMEDRAKKLQPVDLIRQGLGL